MIEDLQNCIEMKLRKEVEYVEEADCSDAELMERDKKRCQGHKDELMKKLKNVMAAIE